MLAIWIVGNIVCIVPHVDQMTLNSCQYHLHATLGNPSNNQSLCLMTIFEITQHHPTQNGTCWEIWTLLFLFFIIIIFFYNSSKYKKLLSAEK